METAPWVWAAWAVAVVVATACFTGAVALGRHERAKDRVQLPARQVGATWAGPGMLVEVEFPGPDGYPRRTRVFSAFRRGLGATPVFCGWVWVARDDPSDVALRPRARTFLPGALVIVGGVLVMAVAVTGLVAWVLSTPLGSGAV
ncbi:hypothetical protein [Actinotalea sp. K2]|uniref:hypothetical protein n=1 Tax=Actinotalea sp. K2 TaxID=2939438 RepID=UPI0020174DD5|nr:hypothetical protein [Actinotalea sp. K2]MCL3859649.1 hypothetical protein [Actinotalea sp. K2]